MDYGDGFVTEPLVGSGTLRAFIVHSPSASLVWGDGQSYDIGAERVEAADTAPLVRRITPDLGGAVVSASDLNSTGIVLEFDRHISPPSDDDPNPLIQVWEVVFLQFRSPTTERRWEPRYSVRGRKASIPPNPHAQFQPGARYELFGRVADTFSGGLTTEISIWFDTE